MQISQLNSYWLRVYSSWPIRLAFLKMPPLKANRPHLTSLQRWLTLYHKSIIRSTNLSKECILKTLIKGRYNTKETFVITLAYECETADSHDGLANL